MQGLCQSPEMSACAPPDGASRSLRGSSANRARDAFRCRPAQRWCDAALCACQKRARSRCRRVPHEERRDGVALFWSAAGRASATCLNAHRRSFDSTECLPPASRLRMLACSLHRHWAYECRSGDAAGAHLRHHLADTTQCLARLRIEERPISSIGQRRPLVIITGGRRFCLAPAEPYPPATERS
ncbi:hypothetical protein J2776_000368 [Paraburkholderia caledonica]|uniref:Uncharacterized protein n=1 Tax=Paraburkholderia caledonica TaxID=134536 RepID=A0ABU1KRV4_9BURK|nr:hypothetical protein [Paraburkholderia caledonica]